VGSEKKRTMIGRLSLLAVGLVIGIALAHVIPGLPQFLPGVVASSPGSQEGSTDEHNPGAGSADDQQGAVKLDLPPAARGDVI
jgi:hypothetical protein